MTSASRSRRRCVTSWVLSLLRSLGPVVVNLKGKQKRRDTQSYARGAYFRESKKKKKNGTRCRNPEVVASLLSLEFRVFKLRAGVSLDTFWWKKEHRRKLETKPG